MKKKDTWCFREQVKFLVMEVKKHPSICNNQYFHGQQSLATCFVMCWALAPRHSVNRNYAKKREQTSVSDSIPMSTPNKNAKENSDDNTNGEQSFNGSNENGRGHEQHFVKISTEE